MRKIVFNEENLKYFQENYGKFHATHFAEKFETTVGYIQSQASRMGLGHSRLKCLLDPHKEEIIDLYLNHNYHFKQIGEKFGVDKDTIQRFLKNLGIKLRDPRDSYKKYTIDETFFEKIDTEAKAYFLGFMYADGYVGKKHHVKLTVHSQDKEILEKFKIEIGSNHILTKEKFSECYNFIFVNKKIHKDLENLGCVNRKSLILKFPEKGVIPDSLMRHFVRGFFDGDGCISYIEKRYQWLSRGWRFSITSTNHMLSGIISFFEENNISGHSLNRDLRCREDVSKLGYSSSYAREKGKTKLKKIYELLYKDSFLFLPRKKEKIEYLLNFVSPEEIIEKEKKALRQPIT